MGTRDTAKGSGRRPGRSGSYHELSAGSGFTSGF